MKKKSLITDKGLDSLKIPGQHSVLIILGMGSQALFLLRTYTKYFDRVYLLGKKDWIAYLSRYGYKKVVKYDILEDSLRSLLRKYGEETPIIISGGDTLDYYLNTTSLHSLNVYPKPLASIFILNNKKNLYKYLEESDLDIGLLSSFSLDSSPKNDYPYILKWSGEPDSKSFKILLIEDEKTLNEFHDKYLEYKDNLLIQKYIKNKTSLSFAAFVLEGDIEAHVIVRQVRQYPMGLTNFVEHYDGKHSTKIFSFCNSVIKRMNFSGYIEFEFVQNNDNENLYLIECNPRPWGWIDFLKYDLSNKSRKAMINLNRDLLFLIRNKKITIDKKFFGRVFNYLSYNKAIFDIKDPLPIIGQIINLINK